MFVKSCLLSAVLLLGGTCVFGQEPLHSGGVEPPVINWRDISVIPRISVGERVDFDTSTVLFLPLGWQETIGPDGDAKLTVHYHGAVWYAIEEHARREAKNPILAFYPGEGSTTYGRLYPNRAPFDEAMTSVSGELSKRLSGKEVKIAKLELESFSAGYGAVREILKWPDVVEKTESVVLADSLYASATTDTQGLRVPDPDQMKPFVDFAKLAAAGKKTMVVAHSSIEIKSYCSTVETADAILKALSVPRLKTTQVPPAAAASGLDFPLTSRGDQGNLHVWGYAGDPAKAHMAIARAIADFWRAVKR